MLHFITGKWAWLNEISCFCLGHWVFTDSHDRHSSPKRDYSVGMFFANQQLKNLSYFLQQQQKKSYCVIYIVKKYTVQFIVKKKKACFGIMERRISACIFYNLLHTKRKQHLCNTHGTRTMQWILNVVTTKIRKNITIFKKKCWTLMWCVMQQLLEMSFNCFWIIIIWQLIVFVSKNNAFYSKIKK